MKKYYPNIDALKGILIIFVIIGHLIQKSMSESLIRHIIYFFHMPLFIGVSGYLFNMESLNQNFLLTLKSFFRKILIPWIIAVIFYTIILNCKLILDLNIKMLFISLIKNFIYPYYHLWYILGYFSYFITIYFCEKIKINKKIKVMLVLFFSLIVYIYYFYIPIQNSLGKVFLHDFRMYNLIFFYLGYLLKNDLIKIKGYNIFKILLLVTISSVITFYSRIKFIDIFLFYSVNILLIVHSLKLCIEKENNQLPNILAMLGQYSLEIYLLHVFPILLIKNYFEKFDVKFYCIVLLFEILCIFFILKIKKRRKNEKISLYNRIKS